ncbi:MAG: hypothetical protein ACK4ND_06060 [Cytophagaceae bacterium]
MKYPVLLALIFIGSVFDGFAQKDTTNNTSNVTVVYSKVQYNKTTHDKEIFNLIKINPLLILRGDIPIYYERRIKDQFSIEAGVGITHRDYLFDDLFDEYNNFSRTSRLGYSFVLAAKFWPSSYTKALDEFYFGPEIRLLRYNYEVMDCAFQSSRNLLSEHRMFTDFKITFGYVSYVTDNVFFDFYSGFGLRSRNIKTTSCEYSNLRPSSKFEIVRDLVPVFSLGVKVGFGI